MSIYVYMWLVVGWIRTHRGMPKALHMWNKVVANMVDDPWDEANLTSHCLYKESFAAIKKFLDGKLFQW